MQRVRRVDIVGDLIDWLPGALAAIGWSGIAAADELTTTESVAVFRTGGAMRDMVTDSAQVTVESCGRTKQRAADMAADIDSLIYQLEGREINGHAVQQVSDAGLAFFPTDSRPTRHSQTFSLDVSAEVIG